MAGTRALIGAILMTAVSGWAQSRDTAAIFGTVKDTQGAVIPGAQVILTNGGTGRVTQVTANENGAYLLNLLPVGSYSLAVEQPAFRRHEQTGILLQANDNIKIDVQLELGDVKTTVSVSVAASQVETRTATLKETVDQARIEELPLDSRNPADLTLLSAGVVPGNDTYNGDADYSPIIRGQKSITINGSRNNNVLFTLDGGENMDPLFNFNMPFPFPDAIQEFSVQSANTALDQGSSSAGVVNTVTKSGTNKIHGNGFWFLRNTDLDATNFFSHQQDQLKQNQAGFTLGGPFIKNRLFYFGGLERLWVRQTLGNSRAESLTAAERKGDFSADGITITDPLTGEPFPNNVIPQSRLSPAAQNLLAITPLPGPDGFADFSYSTPENDWQYIGKADYVINDRQNLTFRVFGSTQDLPYNSPDNNIFLVQLANHNFSQNATLSYNFVISPNLITHTQLTGSHLVTNGASNLTLNVADLGVHVYAPSNDISVFLANSGVSMSTPPKIYFARASEVILHDWTWNKHSHTLTWGLQLGWKQYNENTIYDSSGSFAFNGQYTGFDRADFVLGSFSYFTQNNGELENRREQTRGFYFSDVWRITPRFTVSVGLRYEPFGFFTDTKNRNQTFSPQAYASGYKSVVYLNAPPGLLYYGDTDPVTHNKVPKGVMTPDLDNVAPRIGIAWDPFGDGKSSVRAGYGIYYDAPQLAASNNMNDVAPFSYRVQLFSGQFDNPYAGHEDLNVYPVQQFVPTTPYQSPLSTILLDGHFVTAYMQDWSFTLERQILPDTRLRVGYVGTKGTHLDGEWDENAPIYNPSLTLDQNIATINQRRPYLGYQNITREFYGLNSTYNALQVSLDKRFSHGFTLLSNYTWSKTLDYSSQNNYAGNLVINSFNFFFQRSVSDQNRPQRFVNSFVWDLPAAGGPHASTVVKAVTHDWRLSGILSMMSGRPFTISANGDFLANGQETTPDVDDICAGNPVLGAGRSKGARVAEYFNTASFQNPAPDTYGTLGRNALVGPGFANMDASLVKGFKLPFLGEAGLGQLRFEAFNVFNRTNFGLPDTGLSDPAFGQLISTVGNARILQLAIKLAF